MVFEETQLSVWLGFEGARLWVQMADPIHDLRPSGPIKLELNSSHYLPSLLLKGHLVAAWRGRGYKTDLELTQWKLQFTTQNK